MAGQEVLPECQTGFSDIRLQVGLMERDVQLNREMINKLSEGIEKTQEMNVNLVKMIALHEQRHEQHEEMEDEFDEDVKELHSRITTTTRETHDKIETTKRELFARLDSIHSELLEHIVSRTAVISKSDEKKAKTEADEALKDLTRWKYMLMGALLIIGWLLAHIKWEQLIRLFGG
jgi:DNA anti-recombination protein RmuC